MEHLDLNSEESEEFGVEVINSTDINPEIIVNILKNVFDPDIHYSIYDMGLIYKIEISEEDIRITMTLTSVNCPAAQTLPDEVYEKIKFEFNEKNVYVDITFEPAWTLDNMQEYVKIGLKLI